MSRLDENYYFRKCLLKEEQVPTQSQMKWKMGSNLASVYFKSMRYKLKVLAGLEPPLRGGGTDWFMRPTDLLRSEPLLKPIHKEHIKKLGFVGIDYFGEKLLNDHNRDMEREIKIMLKENDEMWKENIKAICQEQWDDASRDAAEHNTERITEALTQFDMMYKNSLTKIEMYAVDATSAEINRVRNEAHEKMSQHYAKLLKDQSTMLYDRYTEKLEREKVTLKNNFIDNIEKAKSEFAEKSHDIHLEKHTAIEKLRHLLECQNMACQLYVAMKEKEECEKEMAEMKHEHKKKVKLLDEDINLKNLEIKLARDKEDRREAFDQIWRNKVCHVVKNFQVFVSYCLKTLPEHAEFFQNMDKLMTLQLDEAIENPQAPSIFVPEPARFHTPKLHPRPFAVFRDLNARPEIDHDLCPKHCGSSASQLPVVIINDKFIYAACDNFDKFPETVKSHIHHRLEERLVDDHDYTNDIPVRYSRSKQLSELKLEGSLMKILQKEIPNIEKVPTGCCVCRLPFCFCTSMEPDKTESPVEERVPSPLVLQPPGKSIDRRGELKHVRQPKWESYMRYVEPTTCKCPKRAKKHLNEHLPPYMKRTSKFTAAELPNYEPCTVANLKKMVRKARGPPTPPPPAVEESKLREVSTQCEDPEYDSICECYSDDELKKFCLNLLEGPSALTAQRPADTGVGTSTRHYVDDSPGSFTTERARSLKLLLNDSPALQEIFRRPDCNF